MRRGPPAWNQKNEMQDLKSKIAVWQWPYDENQILFILIMFDVKLAPSGRSVDRLPICMNG